MSCYTMIFISFVFVITDLLVGWLFWGLTRFSDLQPYLDLEAGDNQSLKIQVARPGIEPRSSCSASQELNHSATAAPDNWFEIINYSMYYTHVLQMSCLWLKDGFHFKFNSGQLSGLPTELPTVSILESTGLPTELPTELPAIFVYGSTGQSYLHGKIPMGSPIRCPLSYPLSPYMEVVAA